MTPSPALSSPTGSFQGGSRGAVRGLRLIAGGLVPVAIAGAAETGTGVATASAHRTLAWLDYVALGVYFAAVLAIGFRCRARQQDPDEFLRGGGRIRWWAAGVSYMATAVSSISLMVLPAAAYTSDWVLLGVATSQSLAVVVAGWFLVGALRRLEITTVYEYLERRFNRTVRLLGAGVMVLSQVGGRLSVVLLLPAMACSAVTGLNVYLSIGLMGLVTLLYCLKGGMAAVVWTDVLQVALMYGGIVVAVCTIARQVPDGFGGILATAEAAGKLRMAIFDFDVRQPTVWVFLGLGVSSIFMQLGDQALMQRALSTPDVRSARRSVMLGGLLILPLSALLFFLGTALFVFYRQHPAALAPGVPADSIFPYFVGNELPRGLVGLIIAAIFAAAMSTVSGSLNALSAIAVRDFLLVFRPASPPARQLRVARATTLGAGVLTTAVALVMAGLKITSLWEAFATLMALLGGGIPAVYALGLLTRRANGPGVTIGLLVSVAVTFWVKTNTAVHFFFYVTVAVGNCLVVGYLASLLFPPPAQSLAGLTLHATREPAGVEGAGHPRAAR